MMVSSSLSWLGRHLGQSLFLASLIVGTASAQQHTMEAPATADEPSSLSRLFAFVGLGWYCLIWSVCFLDSASQTNSHAPNLQGLRSHRHDPRPFSRTSQKTRAASTRSYIANSSIMTSMQSLFPVSRSCGHSVDSTATSTPTCPHPSPKTIRAPASRSSSRSEKLHLQNLKRWSMSLEWWWLPIRTSTHASL